METISIPLAALSERLPEALRGKVVRKPGAKIACQLPLHAVLEQLPKGVVRLPFGQIRAGSPPGFLADQPDSDAVAVAIPLELLLPVIPPSALARRPGQKQVAIPTDIGAVFGPEAAASAAAPEPAIEPMAEPQASEPLPEPSIPEPLVEPQIETPVEPLPPQPAPEERLEIEPQPPQEQFAYASPDSIPEPLAAVPEPEIPKAPEPEPAAPIRMPPLPPTFRQNAELISPIRTEPVGRPAPAPLPKPPTPLPSTVRPLAPLPVPPPTAPLRMKADLPAEPAPAAVPVSENALMTPLEPLMVQWPAPLSQALSDFGAGQFTIALPLTDLEAQIAKGRISFPWDQLSQWMQPQPPPDFASLAGEAPLNLPLNVLVPLFLARRGKTAPKKQVQVESSIPNLFVGTIPAATRPEAEEPPAQVEPPAVTTKPTPPAFPAPPKPPAPTPYTPAPAAPTPPAMPPTPVSMATPPTPPKPVESAMDLSVLFGQPGKKMWTPMEIVQKTARLPGVSGSLVALQDGLLVASELPGTLNGENLAAFLPQIFARMGYYTRELKMSEPSSIMMVVNQVPFQIFKTGNVFFLAYGRSGSPLPSLQLQAVAAQLERQSQTT